MRIGTEVGIGRKVAARPARLGLLVAIGMVACSDCSSPTIPEPIACGGVGVPRWAILGFDNSRAEAGPSGATVRMVVGESVSVVVARAPDAGGSCELTIDTVAWTVANPGVASLTRVGGRTEARITAVGAGETAVSANIMFVGSPSQVVAPRVMVNGAFTDARVRVVLP